MALCKDAPLQEAASAEAEAEHPRQALEQPQGPDKAAVEFARRAFANGYAIAGEPHLLGRSLVAYKACASLLAEHNSLDALRFIEATGTQEGLYAAIYKRRDRLWMKYDIAVKRWSKKLSLLIDPVDLEVEIRKAIQSAPTDTLKRRAEVKDVIAAYLTALVARHPDLANEIHTAAAEAQAEAKAEGQAAGAALLAHARGEKLPDFNQAVRSNLRVLKSQRNYGQHAKQDSLTMLAGLAGDAALKAASDGGDNQDQSGDYLAGVVGAGVGSSFYADFINHSYWALAALALFASESPAGLVNFVTVGDGKVCPICLDAEAGNPYTISAVPQIPLHASCRCWYTPA